MRTYITSLLLVSLVSVSTGLKCWDSGSEFVNMRATNSIVEKTCESSAKSCMKEWYKASPDLSVRVHSSSPSRSSPGVTSTTS